MSPLRLPVLLLVALLLAGCADTAVEGGTLDAGDGEAAGMDAGEDAAPDASEDPARWYAFAFDHEVTPRSGGSGKIQSYSYTNTREDEGKETTVKVDVTVVGTGTEAIRTSKMDFASGSYEPTVVNASLETVRLRHELTVVTDETGERTPGETSVVTISMPTEELPESSTIFWSFVKMEWGGADDESGSWEYYVTPEMAQQQEGGEVVFLPFQEGEQSDAWWGFDFMTQTYGLSLFSGYVHGDQAFEEGSFSFGGYSQDVHRESVTVGAYTFDAWSVEIRGTSDGESSGWMMKASDDLPIPMAFRFGTEGSESDSVLAYELTDLVLG